MKKYDVVILGSGLGSLVCGTILSKEGLSVCVIEKHHQIGGCLQTFTRKGCIFDTGVHYVGGLGKGQVLNNYFTYFGIMDKLNIKKLDTRFDQVSFSGEDYWHSMGYDNFQEELIRSFPDEKDNIKKYAHRLQTMSEEFPFYNIREIKPSIMEADMYEENLMAYLESVTQNKRLQSVLAGTNHLYAGVPEKSPLYIHALINNANIESAWRFVDGSQQIAESLADQIRSNGGEVLAKHEATGFVFEDRTISAVEVNGEDLIYGDRFISGFHPVQTLKLVEAGKIRNAYRTRINMLENSVSTFILYVVLKKNTFRYLNYNVYYFKNENVWTACSKHEQGWPEAYMMLTPASSASDEYADCVTVMTFMEYDEVRQWENTTIGKRGEDYEAFKKQKTEQVLDLVSEKFPDFRSCIDAVYTSSPLTYRDYTNTVEGAIYGIQKDSNNIAKTLVLPKTKIPNLFLTGQNTNIHGVLGVTIGAAITCAEFMDINYLMRKIKKAL